MALAQLAEPRTDPMPSAQPSSPPQLYCVAITPTTRSAWDFGLSTFQALSCCMSADFMLSQLVLLPQNLPPMYCDVTFITDWFTVTSSPPLSFDKVPTPLAEGSSRLRVDTAFCTIWEVEDEYTVENGSEESPIGCTS